MIFTFSCGNHENKNFILTQFDTSLDSLLTDTTYSEPLYTFFIGDTLHNNPKEISSTCYAILGEDSMIIEANCFIARFENKRLSTYTSETIMGEKYVQKLVYFNSEINNYEVDRLLNKYTDTILFAYSEKFDKDGRMVKQARATKDDYRILTVYKYDSFGRKENMWRKEYYDKKYNPDSIQNTAIKRIEYTYIDGFERPAFKCYINDVLELEQYATIPPPPPKSVDYYVEENGKQVKKTITEGICYTYDEYGNWIKKVESSPESIVIREIQY